MGWDSAQARGRGQIHGNKDKPWKTKMVAMLLQVCPLPGFPLAQQHLPSLLFVRYVSVL